MLELWYTPALFFVLVFSVFNLFKFAYLKAVKKFGKILFWQSEFFSSFSEMFFIFSLFFLVYFSVWEVVSLAWFSLMFAVFYWRLNFYLSKHPSAHMWTTVNRVIFALAGFLFLLNSFLQYAAFRLYILDDKIKYFNIVLFRSWTITCFWLFLFAFFNLGYLTIKSKFRAVFMFLWSILFVGAAFIWAINLGTLRWTGYYFNPMIFSHAGEGASALLFNWSNLFFFLEFVLVVAVFIFIFKYIIRAQKLTARRYWYYYNFSLLAIALFSLFNFSSVWSTPEVLITKSFVNYFKGQDAPPEIPPALFKKMEKFGLYYNPNNYKVAEKEKVFNESKKLLPDKFTVNPPNIFIVFFESFSARLTGVYNTDYKNVTPGLQAMADDKNTTVFRDYHNQSTPTITGILGQMCSLLPPTGHEEIERSSKYRRHYLLCLPEVLRRFGGYKYANYLTAVPSSFANKNTIFASMGMDEVWGLEELGKLTNEKPLSWGYSDHQLYPLAWQFINKAKTPWLITLSTVDNHPPYNLPQDIVKYGDGKNDVLNTVHTSDDAFQKFWQQFKNSEFATNTIVIAVADHSIFSEALHNQYFDKKNWVSYPYDKTMFMMYVPDSILPKNVDTRASGIDLTPTILQMLNINVKNSFEGYSIFGERQKYPSILGMHEGGLYVNELVSSTIASVPNYNTSTVSDLISYTPSSTLFFKEDFGVPDYLNCPKDLGNIDINAPLTLCEYKRFFEWKKAMLEEGRFWKSI